MLHMHDGAQNLTLHENDKQQTYSSPCAFPVLIDWWLVKHLFKSCKWIQDVPH